MIADLKAYPAMKDSGVPRLGKVPEHWNVRRLRNVAEMRVSNVDKRTEGNEQPVRLCNYVDVYKNDRIREPMAFMRATATMHEIGRFRIHVGDVLITKDSEAWNDIGVPALVEVTADDLICGYHLALLRPFAHLLIGGYLFRALQSTSIAYQFHVVASGVTRYGLSHAAIKSIWLPLPPLPEQAAIVRFLDHADRRIRRYIRATQKLIKLLEEQKQAMIQRVVTGQIDVRAGQPYPAYKPSGVEWLGDVPEHWNRCRLKSLLRLVDRRSTSGSEILLSLRRDHGVVIFADHFSRPPQGASLVGCKLVNEGQLVVNRLQANNGLIFRSGLSGLVSPDYSVLEPRSDFDMEYLARLLRTALYRAHFRRESTGLGTGSAGFLRLYDDRLLETIVFLPQIEEQRELLASMDATNADVNRTLITRTKELALLREYRTRLIGDVVTGKLDVREAALLLPGETEEPEPLDEPDASIDAEDATADGLDAAPDEVEA